MTNDFSDLKNPDSKAPRNERSAGFVIFSLVPAAVSEPHYLLLDYGKHWDFPKGHVEAGEDDMTAARRELQEETGLREVAVVAGFARELTYFFRNRKKQLVRKTVIFFLGQTSSNAADVVLSHEHVGFEFLKFEEAVSRLTYVGAKDILRFAHEHVTSSGGGLP